MTKVTGLSRSRQNYIIIEQLLGLENWQKAAEIPTRVGYHDGRKIKMNILKIGNLIESCVGYHQDEYVVLRLHIDDVTYDLKLLPSNQNSYVWVYDNGNKRYDLRKVSRDKVLTRQKMLSSVLHVSLKKLHDAKIRLSPAPGSKPGPMIDRRKGQKHTSPRRRITD